MDRNAAEALILQYRQLGGSWSAQAAELDAALRGKSIAAIGEAVKSKDEMFKVMYQGAVETTKASISGAADVSSSKVTGLINTKMAAQEAIDKFLIADLPETMKIQLGKMLEAFNGGTENPEGLANMDLVPAIQQFYYSAPEEYKAEIAMYLKVSYGKLFRESAEFNRSPGGTEFLADITARSENLVGSSLIRSNEYRQATLDLDKAINKLSAGGSATTELKKLDAYLADHGYPDGIMGLAPSPEDAKGFKDAISDPVAFSETPAVKAMVKGGKDMEDEIARIRALADQEGKFESQVRKEAVLASEGFNEFRGQGGEDYRTPNEALRDYLRAEKATRGTAKMDPAPAAKEAAPSPAPVEPTPVPQTTAMKTPQEAVQVAAGGSPPPNPPGRDGEETVQEKLARHLAKKNAAGGVAQRA
jgi:hypothetical protein